MSAPSPSQPTFSITNKTSGNFSTEGLPLEAIKEEILGEAYELSLVFVEDEESQVLNKKYRDKDAPTNVLSFPLSETNGEIFINVDAVAREHASFERNEENFAVFLFIHGCFHLKGYEHGSKMEEEERKIRKKFNI